MSILPFRRFFPLSIARPQTPRRFRRAVLATSFVFAGTVIGGLLMTDAARAESVPADLHICNADEITSIPELQSDDANNCINDQSSQTSDTDDQTPKALMCAPTGKAYCCTQKVDQLGQCKPIAGGRKRTVPLREPGVTPMGEPGGALPGTENTLTNPPQ